MTGPSKLWKGVVHPQLTQLIRQHPGHGPALLISHTVVWQMADTGSHMVEVRVHELSVGLVQNGNWQQRRLPGPQRKMMNLNQGNVYNIF